MKKTIILSLGLILASTLFLAGCGEKAAEKIIEDSTNGAAEVDIDGDSVTVNTNAGTWTAGEDVSLPASFPSDIHVIEGTIKAATTITEGEVYSVSILTDKSVAEAKAEYDEELVKDGWTETISMNFGDVVSIGADKDDRTLNISIGEDEETGQVLVTIATSKNEE